MTEKRAAVRDLYDKIKMAIDDVQYKQEKIKRKDHEGDNVRAAVHTCMRAGQRCALCLLLPLSIGCLGGGSTAQRSRLGIHPFGFADTLSFGFADSALVSAVTRHAASCRWGVWAETAFCVHLLPPAPARLSPTGPDGCPGVGPGVHDGPAVWRPAAALHRPHRQPLHACTARACATQPRGQAQEAAHCATGGVEHPSLLQLARHAVCG